MRVATLVLFALLQCGRGIEVQDEEAKEDQTVNVTNLDMKPWVPLTTEDMFRPRPEEVEVAAADRSAASPRSPGPDHEAYVQQEIERALRELRAQQGDVTEHQVPLARSRGGEQQQPVKFVYEPEETPDGPRDAAVESEHFHKYLQTYLPHLSSVAAGPPDTGTSYTVGPQPSRSVYGIEESHRLYPLNSIHEPHKAAETHFHDGGKGEHLKVVQSHYKPHIAGLHVESLSHEPPTLAGAGHGSWSHLPPPVAAKGSPHPYPFHGSLEPSTDLHVGLSAPPAIKPYHSHRGQTMGLLKKALSVLTAFIPLGLFLAALTPNVININTTNTDAPSRHRSADAGVQYDLASYPIFGLIEDYGYDSLDDPDCENRIFCEMSRLGSLPNGNAIQKGFWELVHNTPDGMAESLELKDVFEAVRSGSCDTFRCKKKPSEAANEDAADEDKGRKTRDEKETEEHGAKTR